MVLEKEEHVSKDKETVDNTPPVSDPGPQVIELKPLSKKKAKLSDDEDGLEQKSSKPVGLEETKQSHNQSSKDEMMGQTELSQLLRYHQGVEQVKDHDQ